METREKECTSVGKHAIHAAVRLGDHHEVTSCGRDGEQSRAGKGARRGIQHHFVCKEKN